MAILSIECKICGEYLRTQSVVKVLVFDKEHTELHPTVEDAARGLTRWQPPTDPESDPVIRTRS